MLVFENDIVKVIRHDQLYVASPSHTVLSIDEIVKKVEQTLPSDVKVTDVTLFSDPELACKVSLSKPNKAVMYVDQYTGQLKGMYERPAFFNTMQRLHRWLLDSPGNGGTFWGRIIVGTSTIIFVLVLLSGIVIWWPRTTRMLRNSLKIKVSKGRHLLWHSLHIAGGMYALLLLVMALTGLTWSFSWYSKGFYALFGANKTEKNTTPTTDKTATARNEKGSTEATNAQTVIAYTKWQAVYETLRAKNAGYSQITVSDGTASVAFGGWAINGPPINIHSTHLQAESHQPLSMPTATTPQRFVVGYCLYTQAAGVACSHAYCGSSQPFWVRHCRLLVTTSGYIGSVGACIDTRFHHTIYEKRLPPHTLLTGSKLVRCLRTTMT